MPELDDLPGRAAHRLYAHVVWPTLGRIPLVTRPAGNALERHIIVLCRRLDVEPLCVRVLPDRAHVLLRFKPGHAVARLVTRLKNGSEAALDAEGHAVRWGRGYAAVSVGGGDVRRVMRRIVHLREGPARRGVPRRASAARREPSEARPAGSPIAVDAPKRPE